MNAPSGSSIPDRVARTLARSAQTSENAVAVGNRAGIIEWANPAWTRVTGHALDRFVSKPVGDFLEGADIESDVVDFVGSCFREKKVCEIDIPLTTPSGVQISVSLLVEPILDSTGDASDFVVVARDVTELKRAETGADITEIDLSELAMQAAQPHRDALHCMTTFDFSIAEELPLVLGDPSLIRGLVGRAICRAADSTRGGWGTISISTGLLGTPEGPLYRGCLRDGLLHDQYAFIEVHDTGSSPRAGWHQVVEEPFLSGRHSGSAMRISRAKLLIHNQGGEIQLQSNTWDGTAVVILLPYCGGYGLGGF